MNIEVLFFGQLTDITNCQKVEISDCEDTDGLKNRLLEKFPSLTNSKFVLALNNEYVLENTTISPNSKIAVMPPFSGG